MLDEKDDNGLTEGEISLLKSLEEESNRISANDRDTDGEAFAMMRLSEKIGNIRHYARNRKILIDRKVSFEEISGGFIINSPKISGRRYYYYPGSLKWRQEGKSQYYRCKNTNDLLDRFILDIGFKGKKKC